MYPPGASTLREAFTLRVGMCSYLEWFKKIPGPSMYPPSASTLRETFTLREGMCFYLEWFKKKSWPQHVLSGHLYYPGGIYFTGRYVLLFGMI